MARVGISPTRKKFSKYHPAKVTAAVITYIPELKGYHKQRLEILRLTLASLRAHTSIPFDLMIFDNGSCPEVVDYLRERRDSGVIDYLILSQRNIGKIGAFQIVFNAAPGEIVAYCDDDVIFYPGWLEAHLNILETFPQVGMVSGLPLRDLAGRASQTLNEFINDPPPGFAVKYERRIQEEWEADWARSTGRDPAAHLKKTKDEQDLIVSYKGQEALGSATHFQFVAYKRVLSQALPDSWSGRLMGEMLEFDNAVDRQGYIRLSTLEQYVRHLGNVITEKLAEEITEMGLGSLQKVFESESSTGKHWLLKFPGAGRVLVWVYDRLFEILFGGR